MLDLIDLSLISLTTQKLSKLSVYASYGQSDVFCLYSPNNKDFKVEIKIKLNLLEHLIDFSRAFIDVNRSSRSWKWWP